MSNIIKRLLIVGMDAPYHLGHHLLRAANELNISAEIFRSSVAYESSLLWRQISWRLLGHRPPRLRAFSQDLLHYIDYYKPTHLLVTGITPPNRTGLEQIRAKGIVCINYLSDDPWNPAHYPPWFFEALPNYDLVLSPRRANLEQIEHLGCSAHYLPFGYAPSVHYVEEPPPSLAQDLSCDLLFFGGADADRVQILEEVLRNDYTVHLYGGYWNRYLATRDAWKGIADMQRVRWAVHSAKVNLCLVRRANRDEHVMRTFEVPAMGGCMLTENTRDHQEFFGPEGDATLYFSNTEELLQKLTQLLEDEALRRGLAEGIHHRVRHGQHTYTDRLKTIISLLETLN